MFQKFLLSATILISTIFLTTPVAALESGDVVMSITPSNQELELYPGRDYQGKVTVSNVGRLAFHFKASVSRYYVQNDDDLGYIPDFSADNAYTKLPNWITLPQTEFHIEPGESIDVSFDIKVPTDVAAGGQYAAIMLLSDGGEEEGAMKVSGQLAAILYGHVNGGSLRTEAELIEHTMPSFVTDGKFSISQTIKNTGNTDFKVTQKLTIKNFFSNREIITPSMVTEDGQTPGYNVVTVLPGTSRTSILTWQDAPSFGLFQAIQEISYLDQNLSFTTLVFFCPIWLLIVVAALIIATVVVVIVRFKKRKPHTIA